MGRRRSFSVQARQVAERVKSICECQKSRSIRTLNQNRWTFPSSWRPPDPPQRGGWSCFRDSAREVPSWLTSLVVHLLCFLLLTSVTSRVVTTAGSSPLVLKLSLGKELETSSQIEVEVAQSAPETGETEDLPDGDGIKRSTASAIKPTHGRTRACFGARVTQGPRSWRPRS